MHVLLLGAGGREHALAWAIADSPLVERLSCAPGNPGVEGLAGRVDLDPEDPGAVLRWARDEGVDLVVPGPEAPLAAGVVDRLEDAGVAAFGPTAAAARLEASKSFTRELAAEAGIPMAEGASFDRPEDAERAIRERGAPVVVKADGLAAGKGVTVAATVEEALAAVREAFAGRFGAAGARVVVEERMAGTEASLFALCDGASAIPLGDARDYKRAGEGDEGPNTGGMGACSPSPDLTDGLREEAMARIVRPAVEAMRARGTPYRGILYAGLMLTGGGPRLVEFNVRFGDPECQALVPRLRSDLVPAFLAARDGEIGQFDLRLRPEASVCVVLAANGYPGRPETGTEIRGLEAAGAVEGATVFHAGTRRDGGRILAAGGRVLGVTARGAGLAEARERAYRAVDAIDWPGGFCRRDIALAPAGS